MRVLGLDVDTTTPPPQKHHHITTSPPTPPHHHNLAKHRIVLVLGPDASTCLLCLLSCRLKGRDTTDQNIFVISELLMRIITHHTSSTYTHWRVRDMSGKITTKMNISSWAGCCRTPTSTKITRKHRLQFLGRMLQNTEKYENYQETSTSVLEPDVAEHPKVRKLPRKMNISSCAGCCRTPKSTKITRKNEHQFLGRMLQRQKRQKSPSFIVKTPVNSIGEHRKVRELP